MKSLTIALFVVSLFLAFAPPVMALPVSYYRLTIPPSMAPATREIACLAAAIYHEARNSTLEDRLHVGLTVIRRVELDCYPDTICGVIHDKTVKNNKPVFMFPWVENISHPAEPESWDAAVNLAVFLIRNRHVLPTGKSHFYNAKTDRPHWRNAGPKSRIGAHVYVDVGCR